MDDAQLAGGQQPAWPACPRCGGSGVKVQSERFVYQSGPQGPRLASVTRSFVCKGCGHYWSQTYPER